MDHASASFTSPWAVLSGHAITSTNAEHGFGHHHGLPMDLQYPYYRCEFFFVCFCFFFEKKSCDNKKYFCGGDGC